MWCKRLNMPVIIMHKFRKFSVKENSLTVFITWKKKCRNIIIRINMQDLIMIYEHMWQSYQFIKNLKIFIKMKVTATFEAGKIFCSLFRTLEVSYIFDTIDTNRSQTILNFSFRVFRISNIAKYLKYIKHLWNSQILLSRQWQKSYNLRLKFSNKSNYSALNEISFKSTFSHHFHTPLYKSFTRNKYRY